mgnify:CR=1 FL=1
MDKDLNYILRLKDYFSKGMAGAAQLTSKMDKEINKLDKDVKNLGSNFNKTIGNIGKGIAGYFAISEIKNFASDIVDSLKFETNMAWN